MRIVGSLSFCSRGGIGRRVRLRTVWGNPWRFESSREQSYPANQGYPLNDLSLYETAIATENSGVPNALAPGGILRVVGCDAISRPPWAISIETALPDLAVADENASEGKRLTE